jgi:VanZ family protein
MLLMMGTIFFLSNQPGDALQVKLFPGADKVSHMLAYGILAATVIFVFAPEVRARRRVLVLVVSLGVTTLYGVLDEYHQSFIPLRHPEVGDVAADMLGAALVGLLWFYWSGRRRRESSVP